MSEDHAHRRQLLLLSSVRRQLALVGALQARTPRGRLDTAPMLLRALRLLAEVDRELANVDADGSRLIEAVGEHAARHLDLQPVGVEAVRRFDESVGAGLRWLARTTALAHTVASPRARRLERQRLWRGTAFRAMAAALGSLMALVTVEVGLRLRPAGPSLQAALDRAAATLPPPVVDDCDVQVDQALLGDVVRPTSAKDVLYELKPNVRTCFYRTTLTTSDQGLRADQHYDIPKPRDVYRIVLLGDSLAFARGVPFERSFGQLLEHSLGARAGARRVEVVNMAVPGYNTAMEAATYVAKGAAFEPDCVLVFFCGNDLELPHLMLVESPPMLHGSVLLGTLAQAGTPAVLNGWFRVAKPLVTADRSEGGFDVPPEYRHMVGFEGYRRALESLVRAAAPVPVVDFADYGGVLHVASAQEFVAFQRTAGIVVPDFTYPDGKQYWVTSDDGHPNVLAHSLIAERMLAGLESVHTCLP